jgi:very-short-patch-repair endonuclease
VGNSGRLPSVGGEPRIRREPSTAAGQSFFNAKTQRRKDAVPLDDAMRFLDGRIGLISGPVPVRRQISPHAAPLRRMATDAERLLRSRLRGRRLGWKFRFQHTIGPYVGDFVGLERKLIVEADGGQHDDQSDRARTAYLRRSGFRIIRFWNHDILQNIDGVAETILIILEGGDDPRT